jgi:ubiquinone/menaquinone biosynthesis C-methylase UbiE
MTTATRYVLGSSDAEVARLDAQAASLAPATRMLLQAAGIAPGMRVLDLGTGTGQVALELAALVGDSGAVVAIDRSVPLLEVAERRRQAADADNVRLLEADARDYRDEEPFDAVVCRLLLFHLPDADDVLRHHAGALRSGGLMVALDFDLGAARTEPPIRLVTTALGWVEAAFRQAQANPRIGARLARMLRDAGFAGVETRGAQAYLAPDDPSGPAQLAGIVASLAPQIVAGGIASVEEIGLGTLERRIALELAAAGAVFLPPVLSAAWGTAPGT